MRAGDDFELFLQLDSGEGGERDSPRRLDMEPQHFAGQGRGLPLRGSTIRNSSSTPKARVSEDDESTG